MQNKTKKVPKQKKNENEKIIHLCNKLINLFIKYGGTLCDLLYVHMQHFRCSLTLSFSPRFLLHVILWSFSNRHNCSECLKCGRAGATIASTKRHIGMYAHCTMHTRDACEKFPRQEYRILSIIHNVWNSVYPNVLRKKGGQLIKTTKYYRR